MPTTRRIGLSLGADLCWPKCYEDILGLWNPTLKVGREHVRFEVERVTIEPFDLAAPGRYDVVLDRLTHWYANTREWIKKSILLDDLYVLNNPWSVQSMEKLTTYSAMMRLGMPIPETWLVPPKENVTSPDLERTLASYAKFFDLEAVGARIGYPLFMKPYDGGGWVGVTKIDSAKELLEAYDESGKYVMNLQKGVWPYESFIRCVGIGPQVRAIRYDPDAPLHERYTDDFDHLPPADLETLRATTLTINSYFGWDFNSCESLLKDGTWHPIDFANPCPDSQVTSLHRHFPWLVMAKLRWSLFSAATKRPFRKTLDWQPYLKVAATDAPYPEKLAAYAAIARQRFDTERFEAFSAKHFGPLEEIAFDYFASPAAKAAIRTKVEALYPAHEHDEFTERFWSAVQAGRG
ncbi:MAG: hypothetical protein WD226_10045 [Planctomycetota bacterium]